MAPHTAPEAQSTQLATVQSLQSQWDQLVPCINQCKAMQEDQLDKWNDFEDGVDEMDQWFSDVEVSLTETAKPKEDLPEKRTLLEEVKVLDIKALIVSSGTLIFYLKHCQCFDSFTSIVGALFSNRMTF